MNPIEIENIEKIREAARLFIRETGEKRIFAFVGQMGVGKTTFIKGVCEELGVTDVINSPTFAIVNEYYSNTRNESIYHFDFYRIKDIKEAYDLGAEDFFYSGNYCFIEWPEKVIELLPPDTVFMEINEQDSGERRMKLLDSL
jgi:ATPase, YjeE family